MNEVEVSPCTDPVFIEAMIKDLKNTFEDLKGGALVEITTEKEDHNYITCTTSVDCGDYGYGGYFGNVKFVNPESIVNILMHVAIETGATPLGIHPEDISSTEVKLTLKANGLSH